MPSAAGVSFTISYAIFRKEEASFNYDDVQKDKKCRLMNCL